MVDNVSKPFTFTANTYAKASEVNADFDALYTGLNACINQANTNATNITNMGTNKANKDGNSSQQFSVANPTADSHAVNLATLKAMYPVGSIYIGTMSTCPMASLFGTWTKISDGKVLQNSDEDHEAGTTISAGLPNITGAVGPNNAGTAPTGDTTVTYTNGALTLTKNKTTIGNQWAGGGADVNRAAKISINASSSSSVYGNSDTVQPPAYVVNIWERTA